MKAIQLGAGHIGRGFLGQLYWQSGYEIVFVDVDEKLVALLNERRSYPLQLVDSEGHAQDFVIDRVRAISAHDSDAVAQEFAGADLAATSVGANNLVKVAPLIADGIAERARQGRPPLNILLCDNLRHAAQHMREYLKPLLDPEAAGYAQEHIGLIDMVVGRMAPAPTQQELAHDPLIVVAEPAVQLEADKEAFKGGIPWLDGMERVSPIDAYYVRKNFTLNTSHAAFAYLGYPRYEYIWQSAKDEAICRVAAAVLNETCQALVAEYGFDPKELQAYAEDIMRRFTNKALGDTVARVAADPLRKLGPKDRLVGPAQLCEKHGITPNALARVIEAALAYDNPADPKALELQEKLRPHGRARFLREYSQVDPDSVLGKLLKD